MFESASIVYAGYLLQGVIALLVGWAIHRLGEVHVLVNSRSAAQDAKIDTLQTKVDNLLQQLHTQDVTLATERATATPAVKEL